MQQWHWVKMNPNGTIDLDVSQDPEHPDWRHVGRARVKHLRQYGVMAEEADDVTSEFEAKIRADCGYTDDVRKAMERLMTLPAEELDPAEVMASPDIATIQRLYTSRMQRFLLSADNPYPAVYLSILTDPELVDKPLDADMDSGDLPTWAFGHELIAVIVQHWQQVPFTLGTEQTTEPTPNPNREARRAGARKTTAR